MPPASWPGGGPPRRSNAPLIVVLVVVAVALVGAGALLVTQSGGDDEGSSDEEQAYIDAFVEMDAPSQSNYSQEQTRCLAEIVVDTVGVDRLQEAGTPDEIRENAGGGGISDLGIRLDEDQAGAVYERAGDCIDFRALVMDTLRQRGYTEAQIDCVDQYLPDDLLRDSVIAGIMEDEQAELEASRAIDEVTAPCAEATAG